MFGLFASPRRVAKTLGLPENETDRMGLLKNWYKKTKEIKPIPPKFVNACNFMDYMEVGEMVDLLKFPTPRFHELDSSRYFGTYHAVIGTPDEKWGECVTAVVKLKPGQEMNQEEELLEWCRDKFPSYKWPRRV